MCWCYSDVWHTKYHLWSLRKYGNRVTKLPAIFLEISRFKDSNVHICRQIHVYHKTLLMHISCGSFMIALQMKYNHLLLFCVTRLQKITTLSFFVSMTMYHLLRNVSIIFYCYTDMKHFDRCTNSIIRVANYVCASVKLLHICITVKNYRNIPYNLIKIQVYKTNISKDRFIHKENNFKFSAQ